MHFSTSTSKSRDLLKIAAYFSLLATLLLSTACWNYVNWSHRTKLQYRSSDFPQNLRYFFQNGNISPIVSLWLYRHGITVRPSYAVVGKNGWLFLGDRFQKVVTKAAGAYPINDLGKIERWALQLKERQDWLMDNGTQSLFVVAPNKHSIYSEKSPNWLSFEPAEITTKLVDAGVRNNVYIVDPRQALITEKSKVAWLYNRADTHWTYPGAFVSYRLVMKELSGFYPDLKMLSETDVSFTIESLRDAGLTKFLGFPKEQRGIADRSYHKNFKEKVIEFCALLIEESFDIENVCSGDVPISAASTKKNAVQMSNPSALNDLSVLLVEDSFGEAPAEFYNRTFTKVWHAQSRFILTGKRLKKFVKTYKPDIVIYRIVERNILHPISYEFDGKSGLTAAGIE